MGMAINRFEVYLVTLDPTIGTEIKKTRPCLVISPDEMNQFARTVIELVFGPSRLHEFCQGEKAFSPSSSSIRNN